MPKSTDWETIEREFRAGQLSTRVIASQHGITEGAIRKRAKTEGWTRDLSERVRREARSQLLKDGTQPGTQEQRANEARTVEAAALRQVEVVRQHRQAIGRGRDLTLRLLDELDATTSHIGQLETEIEAATASDLNSTRRTAMLKAVSLPSRAGVIKDLSAAAKNWVALERQAFNIDDGADANEPATKGDVRSALKKLDQDKRDQLRAIAEQLAGGPCEPSEGA